MSTNHVAVLFDDQCNKCTRWADFIRSRDPKSNIKLVGQNSSEGLELLSEIPTSMKDLDSIFLVSKGEWYSKSAAIWRVCRKLRFPWQLASAMLLVPYPIRDYFYDVYARMRK